LIEVQGDLDTDLVSSPIALSPAPCRVG